MKKIKKNDIKELKIRNDRCEEPNIIYIKKKRLINFTIL